MAQPRVITPLRSSKDVRSPRNGRRKSGTPRDDDSPSRQLLLDLERAMGRMQVHTVELQKVRAFNRRSYYEGLEAWTQERTEADLAAIDAANAKHQAVRQDAEAELAKYYQEQAEQERRRKAEEERLEKERVVREKAERERKEREEAERQAKIQREKEAMAVKKAAEDKAKADAEEARQKEREETAAREKAEKHRANQEAAQKAAADKKSRDEKAAEDQQAASQARVAAGGVSPELLADHKRYLDIHSNLKKFRKEFMAHAKMDPKLKSLVGDMRRAMRTAVGQLTDSKQKGANTIPTQKIRTELVKATTTVASPPVNLTPYIYIDSKVPATQTEATVPSLLLYLFSMLTKAVFASFTGECAVNPKAAEPIGTLVAQIFASPEFQVQLNPSDPSSSTSLISVLMSKFHATCPVLFGITGDESTSAGRQALGWRREFTNDKASQKSHVPETTHYSRLVGLAAGYAAISLRNFAKAVRLQNPWPPKNFWASLANIVNTPPAHVTNSHLIVLKNILEGGVERFLLFYGNVGVAALKEALVVLPQKLQAQGKAKIMEGSAGRGLVLLVDTFEKEKNLRL